MRRAAAPCRRRAAALAALVCACCALGAAAAPTSNLGEAGSQGHSEAPFKILSTTPGSGSRADNKVTATPWDIVVLTLGTLAIFICCVLGIRRLLLRSAKEAAALQAALAALEAERYEAESAETAPAVMMSSERSRSRDRRAPRAPVALPAGDRQLPQLPARGRRGGAPGAASGRIPSWRRDADTDAALAASEAGDAELVPMYTFTPESRADGEWFVAPLAHLPAERPRGDDDTESRQQRRQRRRERDAPQPQPPPPAEAQKSGFWGLPPGWG